MFGSSDVFRHALDVLLNEGSVKNGSKGFEVVSAPSFLNEKSAEDVSSRIGMLMDLERDMQELIAGSGYYDPDSTVEEDVSNMSPGSGKTLMERFIIGFEDIEDLESKDPDMLEVLLNCMDEAYLEPDDDDLFSEFELSPNLFMYVMNRSLPYYRLMQACREPGMEYVLPTVLGRGGCEGRFPLHLMGEDMVTLNSRFNDFVRLVVERCGAVPEQVIRAIVYLFDGIQLNLSELTDCIRAVLDDMPSETFEGSKVRDMLEPFLICGKTVKYLPSDDVFELVSVIDSLNVIGYGVSVDMLYHRKERELNDYGITSTNELSEFLVKYTGYDVVDGRVLKDGGIREAICRFIRENQMFDKDQMVRTYIRRCGGPSEYIQPIIDTIDVSGFGNKVPLTDEEHASISSKLESYEWITKDNAMSIFADLNDVGHKFTDTNMFLLGFTGVQDVYYRSKYQSYTQCLLENDFAGDDAYVDAHELRIMKECRYFDDVLDNLKRSLHIVPISECRFVNLHSERYSGFHRIVQEYRSKVDHLCRKKFVTPYSLKNMKIGIPDIDEDDFCLEFYDSVLLSTGSNHKTISNHRFYFKPSECSEYSCYTGEFLRFIVHENGGSASMDELQIILEDKYGIKATIWAIRSQAKASSCVFDSSTDTAYLDEEAYREMFEDE